MGSGADLRVVGGWHTDRTAIPSAEDYRYDVAITAVGYEARARYISSVLLRETPTKVAFPFRGKHVLSFEDNLSFYSAAGFSVPGAEDDYCTGVREVLARAEPRSRRLEVAVDISSLTRVRMAACIDELVRFSRTTDVRASFLYAPARFASPPADGGPILTPGPVFHNFTGSYGNPSVPVLAVVGLGYEPNRALGALEFIEPATVVAFSPDGGDERYASAVEDANASLLRRVDRELHYPVNDPVETIARLESFVFSAELSNRVMLVPMGPKIFSICSLVVAASRERRLPVWRVSAGEREDPRDVVPDGSIVSLVVDFNQADTVGAPIEG